MHKNFPYGRTLCMPGKMAKEEKEEKERLSFLAYNGLGRSAHA